MNKIAVLIGSLFISTQAVAVDELSVPVFCVDYATLERTLDKYKEVPFVRGKSQRGTENKPDDYSMVLFVNRETKTWTLVEQVEPDYYCVIGVGEKFEAVPANIINDVIKRQNGKAT
jgi:hypothetical protein